jgi:hypothetical protein
MDADRDDRSDRITIQRHSPNMNDLAEDVGERIAARLEKNPAGCIYFNPAVTICCPLPKVEFIQIVRKEQGRWCRQASRTIPRRVRRIVSAWVSHRQISNKYGRYLDRALSFTGIMFIEGEIIPSSLWSVRHMAKKQTRCNERSDVRGADCDSAVAR